MIARSVARLRGPADSDARGQVDPTVALVAVFALCLGISLYAVVLSDAVPSVDRDVATPTLARVSDRVVDAGVATPGATRNATTAAPAGYGANVSLAVGETRWDVGPRPPRAADRAARPVSVRLAPGRVRLGELSVAVWRGSP